MNRLLNGLALVSILFTASDLWAFGDPRPNLDEPKPVVAAPPPAAPASSPKTCDQYGPNETKPAGCKTQRQLSGNNCADYGGTWEPSNPFGDPLAQSTWGTCYCGGSDGFQKSPLADQYADCDEVLAVISLGCSGRGLPYVLNYYTTPIQIHCCDENGQPVPGICRSGVPAYDPRSN